MQPPALKHLWSFVVCMPLVRTVYNSMAASAIHYVVICWRVASSNQDRKRLNKLVRRASSVLGCPLDSVEEVGEKRMVAKLASIMDSPSHLLHQTVEPLSSTFSGRVIHLQCS